MSLLILAPARAEAAILSRLGNIYLYDPISFDGGPLQRGSDTRAGVASDRSWLTAGVDLPFFRELSLRVGYRQEMLYRESDPLGLELRLRMPVVETARYGQLSSAQVIYSRRVELLGADPLAPRDEVGAAYAGGNARGRRANSVHAQLTAAFREARGQGALDWAGLSLKAAHLLQVGAPPPGLGGTWTVTLSTAELDALHFGLSPSGGGEGRIYLGAAGVGLHMTPRSATYSLGLLPRVSLRYGPGSAEWGVGGVACLTIGYRPDWE